LCGAVKDEGVEIDRYFKPCTLKVKSDQRCMTFSRPPHGDQYLKLADKPGNSHPILATD
jgi:hypothetical protein